MKTPHSFSRRTWSCALIAGFMALQPSAGAEQAPNVFGDFDGDHRADLSYWQPATGLWWTRHSLSSYADASALHWGNAADGDQPVAADYDGDGLVDPAVWQGPTGLWLILKSSSGYQSDLRLQWGRLDDGDRPVPSDFDGDGRADPAVWQGATGMWYVLTSSTGYARSMSIHWGRASDGDRPVPADFDGDGKADPAVWQGPTGMWYVLESSGNYATQMVAHWGRESDGDRPMPADYDGDRKADPAVWQPDSGMWALLDSSTDRRTERKYYWGRGALGHRPAPLDYDGDGRADLGIWGDAAGADGGWFFTTSSSGYTDSHHALGSQSHADWPVSLDPERGGTEGDSTCLYAVSPPSVEVDGSAQTLSLEVATSPACAWSATEDSSFLAVQSGASGAGTAGITVYVDANGSGGARAGTLRIQDEAVEITQRADGGASPPAPEPTPAPAPDPSEPAPIPGEDAPDRPPSSKDRPVIFVHGFNSGPEAWSDTASRLQERLFLKAYVADLPWYESYERQADLLQGTFAALPESTVAIGHSNGGVISRQWSRARRLRGIITLGTPHRGSLLIQRATDFLNFNYLLNDALGVLRLLELEEGELQWIYTALTLGTANMQALTRENIFGLLSTLGIGLAAPVAGEMVPGSVFLAGLNSADNLSRESEAIIERVGLVFAASGYNRASYAVGLFPEYRDLADVIAQSTALGLEYFAEYIRINYPPWSTAQAVRQNLLRIAFEIRQLTPRWCWAVTGDATCTIPHDGIVSAESQVYPGAANFGKVGPAHTQETRWSDEELAEVLRSIMLIRERQ